jgi:hypothetical protein
MGLISRFVLAVTVLVCFAGGPALYAQNALAPPGTSTGTELQNIEKILTRPGISALERRDALIRLARLRQLSGDIEGAAKSWLDAAKVEPVKDGTAVNTSGDTALVAGAFCLASMGEWEASAAALGPLLASGRQGPATWQARYLDACLGAWNSGDSSALISLANNPEYAGLRPVIYYTLWKTAAGNSGPIEAETWKTRLLVEFPHSPESRIAVSENGGTPATISARPSPLWLLLPGRGSFALEALPAAPSGVAAPQSPPAPDAKGLQTGLFSSEANARVHMQRLTSAGFSPSLGHRMVNGVEYWTVTVPAGQNSNRTIMELKNAGFESFPVF